MSQPPTRPLPAPLSRLLSLALILAPMLLMLTGINACGEDTPPPGSCRTETDCENGQICVPPGQSAGCGMCYQPENTCTTSKDCTNGTVCALDESPCQCNGPTYVCMPACTADSCPAGQACTGDGTCQYLSCATGAYTCEPYTTCTSGAPHNGCQRWTCETDNDCSGGRCVEGQCYEDFGYCSYLPPVAPGLIR